MNVDVQQFFFQFNQAAHQARSARHRAADQGRRPQPVVRRRLHQQRHPQHAQGLHLGTDRGQGKRPRVRLRGVLPDPVHRRPLLQLHE